MPKWWNAWRVVCILVCLFAASAVAQTNLASVTGEVTDPKGKAVPNAKLIIRSPGMEFTRATISNGDGLYEFVGLKPGDYELQAEAAGFGVQARRFALEVSQRLRLDVAMPLGKVQQQVQVVGTAQGMQTSDASLGTVIEPEMTSQLPLNGRHLLDLALTIPNAHQGFGAQSGTTNPLYFRPGQNSALVLGGNRPNANYFLLDGSTDTDPTFSTLAFSPSPDAVEEFKVDTGGYSAEYGGAGGGQINIITKSGTGQFHGTVYEFIRNGALDARAFNENQVPPLVQNQFGASLGGPIQKGKTFFFANYEGFRMSTLATQIETVPTLLERLGNFSQSGQTIYNPDSSYANPNFNPSLPVSKTNPKVIRNPFPGDAIPAGMMNSVSLAAVQHFPLPNIPQTVGKPDSNNYRDVRPELQSTNQATFRLDHDFARGDALFARYSAQGESGFTPENLPTFGAYDNNVAQNLTVGYTHILSPVSVNNLWIGASRLSMHRYAQDNYTNNYIAQLGIKGVGYGGKGAWGMPWFAIQGYNGLGDSFAATPVGSWDTLLNFGDTWSRQMGRHSLKVGGDYRPYFWPMWGFFQNRGFYQFTSGFTTRTASNDGTGSGLAAFLLGDPVVKQRQAGIPIMDLHQWYGDAFIQDDWRMTQATTLNIGLRYEYMSPLTDVQNPNSNLAFINSKPYAFIGGQLGMPRGLMNPNTLDFAPRFGLAHEVSKGHFVIRAGYGIFFTPVDMNTWCDMRHQPPLVFPETQQSDNFVPSLNGFNFGPAVLGQTVISYTAIPPYNPPEYISQWNFTVQKALPGDTIIEVGYDGERVYHLQQAHLINNAQPGPGSINPRRPFQTISFLPGTAFPAGFNAISDTFPVSAINLLQNSANSWYDAGWVNVRRRFQHGLTFLANYTWSKSLTDGPDFRSAMDESTLPQNNSNLAAEKGLACDVPERLAASAVYEIPGWKNRGLVSAMTNGWSTAGIYTLQAGYPFTISVFGDTANAGTLLGENPIRGNYTGAPIFPAGTQTASLWFNPLAFATPPSYTFGNAGRNTLQGPGLQELDLALMREFHVAERYDLQFRAEFFNALNNVNMGTPNRYVNEPGFGTITTANTQGREVQLSARFSF
ncbi:MAG TPA: carboxypeptidase regulatory-like domain-containing protein [Terriglobia bacterium]|nr:carboxypeptidase regulatory-like domain-containing protein [Terriglobia bacterium]